MEIAVVMLGVGLFILLGVVCLLRGLHKFRRARELEREPRFRLIAHQTRFVGWFLLLCSLSFTVAAIYVQRQVG